MADARPPLQMGSASGEGAPDRRLGRDRRLLHAKGFREAYAQGRRFVGRCMVLWLRQGPGAGLRLGVVSSRRVGGSVERNRARRRLREAYRRHRHLFRGEVDVELVARQAVVKAPWRDVVADLLGLAERAGLLPGAPGDGGRPVGRAGEA